MMPTASSRSSHMREEEGKKKEKREKKRPEGEKKKETCRFFDCRSSNIIALTGENNQQVHRAIDNGVRFAFAARVKAATFGIVLLWIIPSIIHLGFPSPFTFAVSKCNPKYPTRIPYPYPCHVVPTRVCQPKCRVQV